MPAPMGLTVLTTVVVTVLMVLPVINRQDIVIKDVTQDILITNATKVINYNCQKFLSFKKRNKQREKIRSLI